MTYRVTPFQRWHVAALMEQGDSEGGFMEPEYAMLRFLEQAPLNWTLVADDQPVMCGGFIKQWEGRYVAWAYMNRFTHAHMLRITRETQRRMAALSGRIEMTVRADFAPGNRWARLLGFEVETPVLRQYGPFGENHIGYVKVQK